MVEYQCNRGQAEWHRGSLGASHPAVPGSNLRAGEPNTNSPVEWFRITAVELMKDTKQV